MPTGRSPSQIALLGLGLLAGAWAFLTPILVFLPTYEPRVLSDPVVRHNAFDAGRLGEALAALGPAAGLGLLGIAGTLLLGRGFRPARLVVGGSAIGLLALSVLTASSVGWFLFAPAVLLFLTAMWVD